MNNYTKNDFYYEEDFITSATCENCGTTIQNEDDIEQDICPNCNGKLHFKTAHDCTCHICRNHIHMWNDAARHDTNKQIIICKNCYIKLPEYNPYPELYKE